MNSMQTNPSVAETNNNACPSCGEKGKAVKPVTLKSLLTDEAQRRADDLDGFRFCPTPGCDVAYYRAGGDRFVVGDVRVPIGQKQTDASRLVCYCFDHTASEIEADVEASGTSTIPDDIAAKCKQGLDRCPETNPQGSCCLANVKAALKDAQVKHGVTADPSIGAAGAAAAASCCDASAQDTAAQQGVDCCGKPESTKATKSSSGKGGLFATGGAVVAAILSSACCWLPLLLIAFGASAAGVSGFFEQYRFVFLGATAVLLAGAFYLVYRKPRCGPGEACAVPNVRLQRFNKGMLWVATMIVVAFAAFPNYVGALIGGGSSGADTNITSTAAPDRTFQIEGMTCEGCAANLGSQLTQLPGVARAEVSYPDKSAKVYFKADAPAPPTDEQLQSQIVAAGFKGVPASSNHTVNINISGMTCEGCAAGLAERLKAIPTVKAASVDYKAKRAVVIVPADTSIDPVLEAVRAEGFEGKVSR